MFRLTIIVAATKSNGIGQNAGLPWHLSRELKYFAQVTTAAPEDRVNAVIMGRNTWESIPKKYRPLPRRVNIVTSRNENYELESSANTLSYLHTSLASALERLKPSNVGRKPIHRAFVIGGASLYSESLALPASSSAYVDRILLTRIISPAFDACDAFMPDFFKDETDEGRRWGRASHGELEEWVGFKVPEGVQEENGVESSLALGDLALDGAKAIWNTNAFFAYVITVKLFKLKWEPRRLLAVLLATLGVIVVVYGGSTSDDDAQPSIKQSSTDIAPTSIKPSAPLIGDLLTLVASIGYGLYQVLYKKYAALSTDPEVVSDRLYDQIPSENLSVAQCNTADHANAVHPLPFGLHANFLTTCMGLLTLVILWLPIPFLHYFDIEPFMLPPNSKTTLAIAGISLSGVVFNAGFMVLLGIWGPIITSVGNLLTIVLVFISDAAQLPTPSKTPWITFFTMRFFAAVFAAIAIATPAFAVPSPLRTVEKFSGKTSGKYIVKVKKGVSRAALFSKLKLNTAVTHDWKELNGFAGNLDEATLNALRASDDVEFISEDGIMHTMVTQTNAPWGLSRLSSTTKLANQSPSALTFSYTYDASAGAGVDIYVVDTGVFTSHSQFGGRARWGATFGGYANADGNGHGTHCAGTAAGSQFGVAKAASIIAVKVLSDAGSGSTSDIVSGMNWVLTSARASGRPSIVSMSLGGGASTALDNAVATLTNAGIHVVVAAGNSNVDAGSTSPARAPSAVTVGASTIADARASFSNYGSVVDIFAPGQNVISSWIGSTTATNNISGTSMACPHVAGLVAYLIGTRGNQSPAAMSTLLKSLAIKNAITGLSSSTANNLAHNA
ncbi:hypothetical protein D9615_001506 [Tricholomella constricta]|uniref:dihydrofolate reductase n=1 Tax=Tricholomella constricta TaxID=117010 RepID=A0A8H5HKQ4_9AGAR|nr:hypothetical protein D9615_001506 [Tricholomella constricta]